MRLFTNGRGRTRLIAAALVLGLAAVGSAATAWAADSHAKQYKIALITHAQAGDTFWDLVRKGATAAAKKDNVDLIYLHGDSPDKQAAKLQNVITQHVDGIALTLAFPDAMKPLVQQALKDGIPVVGVNSGFSTWKSMGIPMYVGQDETLAGQAIGKRLNKEGAKNELCVNQQQGAVQLAARCKGVADTFKGKSETLYLEGYDMSKARSRIMAKLMQDPQIDTVVTLGAPFAPVAVDAARKAHSKASVVTFDLNPRTAKLVKEGKVKWAVDQQPWLQGYEAVDLLYLNLTNGDTLGGGNAVLTGPAFVTQDNIDKVMKYVKRGTR
ncbi:substrate-binding domain-containing protein [Salinisphaera sp. LB1]|uniref:substrate-binding domain-containing protein n=1 Tax=Salinisphaera sp. LB1 TaxID=2183911 RepID=UPI000D7050C6|nr:substrate-binding domain-containing protein [Salinisphaera sp. LB1]AWN17849.1 Inositol transport system sugar-binding protein [Salinisphaera sp. LB1]